MLRCLNGDMAIRPLKADDNETIGARIIRLREAMGMTQLAFAERIGWSAQRLSSYERGITRLRHENAMEIEKATESTIEWIYRGVKDGMPYGLMNRIDEIEAQEAEAAASGTERRRGRGRPRKASSLLD